MRKIVAAVFLGAALLAAGYLLMQNREAGVPAEARTYESRTHGISFSYPSNYLLVERELGTPDAPHYGILIIEDTEANRALLLGEVEGGEGAAAITLDIFPNQGNLSLETWVRGSADANFGLSPDGILLPASIGGVEALAYQYDGLYRTDAAAALHSGSFYLFSGNWSDEQSPLREAYLLVLNSARFAKQP